MANANSTPVSRKSTALRVEEHSWGKCCRGTKEAFIESGLIKPEWFPGLPGNPKCSVQIGMVDGELKIIPYLSMGNRQREELRTISLWKVGKRFAAYVRHPQEELDRIEKEEERRSRFKEIEKLHAEKKQSLENLPKSKSDFLEDRSRYIKAFISPVFIYFQRAYGGFHYSREVIEKARDLMSELFELAEEGDVYFDKTRYQYALDDIEEKHVKANPEFSAFMATTLAIGKAAT